MKKAWISSLSFALKVWWQNKHSKTYIFFFLFRVHNLDYLTSRNVAQFYFVKLPRDVKTSTYKFVNKRKIYDQHTCTLHLPASLWNMNIPSKNGGKYTNNSMVVQKGGSTEKNHL